LVVCFFACTELISFSRFSSCNRKRRLLFVGPGVLRVDLGFSALSSFFQGLDARVQYRELWLPVLVKALT
jgi:hypothetical protein